MNFIDKIKDRYYAYKLEKLKEKCARDGSDEFYQTGKLPGIEELSEIIGKMKEPALPEFPRYGDEFDEIESIFFNDENADVEVIMKKILNSRVYTIISKDTEYTELITLLPKYANRYGISLEDSNKVRDNSIISQFEAVLPIYQEVLNNRRDSRAEYIGQFFNKFFHNAAKILVQEKDKVKSCELVELLSSKMPELIEKWLPEKVRAEYTLEGIQGKLLELVSVINETKGKSLRYELDRREIFREYGINFNENINFINAENTEFVRDFEKEKKEKRDEFGKVGNVERGVGTFGVEGRDIVEDELMLVRTDDYFPMDKKMEVIDEMNNTETYCPDIIKAICNRNIAEEFTKINYEGKELNFVNKNGLFAFDKLDEFKGTDMFQSIHDREAELLEQYGLVSSKYRSTKHFALNGLVSSHVYGNFSNRSYIFLDPFSEHKNDEMLNFNPVDTYYKVSRERPFILSDKAILMIPISRYKEIVSNPEMRKQLSKYKDVTVFNGDEKTAVEMKLNELGIFSVEIGAQTISPLALNNAMEKFSNKTGYVYNIHFNSEVDKEDKKITLEMKEQLENKLLNEIYEKFGENQYTVEQQFVIDRLHVERAQEGYSKEVVDFIQSHEKFELKDIELLLTLETNHEQTIKDFIGSFNKMMAYDYVGNMSPEKFEELKQFIQDFKERERENLEEKRRTYFEQNKEKSEELVH